MDVTQSICQLGAPNFAWQQIQIIPKDDDNDQGDDDDYDDDYDNDYDDDELDDED